MLDAYLGHVERISGELDRPLTPALLEHWLGEKVCELRYSPAFYVGLVHELRPAVLARSGRVGRKPSCVPGPKVIGKKSRSPGNCGAKRP
jgi:hypothetical protein